MLGIFEAARRDTGTLSNGVREAGIVVATFAAAAMCAMKTRSLARPVQMLVQTTEQPACCCKRWI
jgi:hypothetical protein